MLRKRRNSFFAALSPSAKELCFSATPGPVRAIFDDTKIVGSYHAITSEATTEIYHNLFVNRGKCLALPYFATRDVDMVFRRWNPGEPLERGPFDVMQPLAQAQEVTPDLLIAPLVGFDSNGRRLGQGGGHYDHYFARHPDVLRIGLAWSVQQCEAIPLEAHDQLLDCIITQEGVITPASSRLRVYAAAQTQER
ncbi:5-formyltetrahydrofolate cyclo-ligase [Alterisphingorhabdus coralli]|uniref:5-formyltetrahydrofolate cyclo-ligase n=1 Tax=Alterisphingorhabdus coralli TaxID=3071408 RepID=A0AA97I1Z2_9SPHN|nr:5-formyltetrahydrofolate cyclo-ligase [Parasphingorhabdus sp. SCSIO 66989]WOE76622.1 5-formyltetrahydrofolate cyclo-ligase [Parasphingorhabdus sp. SCSIO 66989]